MEICVNRRYIFPLKDAKNFCPASIKVARTILNSSFPYKDKEKKIKEISAKDLSALIGMKGSKFLFNKNLEIKNELESMGSPDRFFKAVYYKNGVYTFYITEAGELSGDTSKYHIHYVSSVWEGMDSSYSVLLYEKLKDLAADEPEPVLTLKKEDLPQLKLTKIQDLYKTIKRAEEQISKTDLTITGVKMTDNQVEIRATI